MIDPHLIHHPSYLEIAKRVQAEKSFYEFVKQAWIVIDSDYFIPNWHIECICVHMEALNKREIKILDVNIPFGFAKSIICSVLYPAWVWTTNPSRRFLTGSHNMALAIRDTLKCRRLIESPWYQHNWGHVFQLTTDQNTKANFENNMHGYRIAFSSTGGTTGLRGDDILLDDALSQSQSESDLERTGVNDFLGKTLFSRQNITKETAIMGIGQRFHPDDYHAVLLSLPGCFHLTLPLEYIPEEAFNSPYFKDPRAERGEILWKIPKFNEAGIALLKQVLGTVQYAAQCQQKPRLVEGSLIKRSYWNYYRPEQIANLSGRKIIGGDCAAKEKKQNDYTVFYVFKKIGSKFYVIDFYRKKVEFPQMKRDFITLADKHKPNVIYIEDASNGTPLLSVLKETVYKNIINPFYVRDGKKIDPGSTRGKDKVARLMPNLPIFEAGDILLPENGIWNETIIEECANFPNGTHDDIVDPLSLILNAERVTRTPGLRVMNL